MTHWIFLQSEKINYRTIIKLFICTPVSKILVFLYTTLIEWFITFDVEHLRFSFLIFENWISICAWKPPLTQNIIFFAYFSDWNMRTKYRFFVEIWVYSIIQSKYIFFIRISEINLTKFIAFKSSYNQPIHLPTSF